MGNRISALDKNGDGVINDSHELFGPSTGDGFGEPAAYTLIKISGLTKMMLCLMS